MHAGLDTGVQRSDLTSFSAGQIADGIPARTLEDARETVANAGGTGGG